MSNVNIYVTDPELAGCYADRMFVGKAFAFIDSKPCKNSENFQTALENFYGPPQRRTISLVPNGRIFPGFKIHPQIQHFKQSPILLPDKEIYQAIHDTVRLSILAPNWSIEKSQDATSQQVVELIIERNLSLYRTQTVELAAEGLTLVELTQLPVGNYRVYLKHGEDWGGYNQKFEWCFNVAEYVLSPLQATLMSHELQESNLNCRLQVELFNRPFNQPVQVELWSGDRQLDRQQLEPVTVGIYDANFNLPSFTTKRLELRISYLDGVATVAIPGSQKVGECGTLLSNLGREVRVSMMPQPQARLVRGLYVSEISTVENTPDRDIDAGWYLSGGETSTVENTSVKNTPAIVVDPTPANRQTQLQWMVAAQAARLLILDFLGNVCCEKDLGDVVPGQEIDIEVPTPGGLLAIAAWIENKAWEGWSALLVPSTAQLEITAPATANPGETIELNLTADRAAAIYLRVRDSRLTGASPEELLAASLKEELQKVSYWATSGYIAQNLAQHPELRRFRGSNTVGIDLGATHSKVAICKRYGQAATEIASIPSVVAYTQNGTCLVGEEAKRQAALNPENTFHYVKNFIGRKYDEVVREISRSPYQITNFNGDIQLNCPNLGKQLTPQEIVAEIIRKLIEVASNHLEEQVTQAVITVPAYFEDSQRQAIREAGKIAGIEVLRIINEPTAASLACGLDKKSNETILVFDLGGGTCDVSILEVGDGVFEVYATNGETHLGGDEFDKKIVDFIASEFQRTEGIDLRKDKQALQRLTEAAEKAKIELSSVTETEINLPFIIATQDGPKHLDATLTRAKFEELCSDSIARCRILVENAIRDAKLNKSDINEVVLVGGSTQIPAVKALVRQMLDREPQQSINPTEAVVFGAAIQASVLSGEVRDILLLDLPDRSNGNLLPRANFSDVAYCGLVRTDELGKANVSFKLPDAITSYNIEAFAFSQSGTEWCSANKRLEVSQPVWAEFKLPKFIYPGDKSLATLYVKCSSGQFGLRLWCNGDPVEFSLFDAKYIAPHTYQGEQAKVIFEVQPGEWRAQVQDLVTQDCDICLGTVGELGKFSEVAQRFQLLRAGETFDLRSHQVLELRVLSGLEKPFNLLCDATTNYEHHCCEQTAAKLLAAVASLTAGGDAAKLRDVIIAGAAREQKMYLPGKGLALYPPGEWGSAVRADDYWGRIAAQHLCDLSTIGESLFGLAAVKSDRELESALRSAIAIGEGAAAAYNLPMIPTQIASGRDAYRSFMRLASTRNEALLYARSYLKTPEKRHQNNVINRSDRAYCAAVLLLAGESSDLGLALNTVNQLALSLNASGRLYSTVDSVGAIALMSALQATGINLNGTVCAMQEGEMRALESERVFSTDKMEYLALKEGAALVELKTMAIEDWNTFGTDFTVMIQLRKPHNSLQLGDTVELIVQVESYQPGLLLEVCLPPALSRLQGGGEVKRFSVDFCGQNRLEIPLQVTGCTLPAGEHWRAVVRNMFDEEQTGNSGLLCVRVGC